jgi:hypothetical protein
LSPKPKMDRGSWRRTFVSRMKFFFKSRRSLRRRVPHPRA